METDMLSSGTMIAYSILMLLSLVINIVISMQIARKSNQETSFLVYLPYLNNLYQFRAVNMSAWSLIGMLVPILNVYIMIKLIYRLLVVFGFPMPILLAIVGLLIPGGAFIFLLLIAFVPSIQFTNIYGMGEEKELDEIRY